MIFFWIVFIIESITLAFFLLRRAVTGARQFIDRIDYMDKRLRDVEAELQQGFEEFGDEIEVLNTVLRDVYEGVGEIGDVVFLPETPQPKNRHLKAVRGDDDDAG